MGIKCAECQTENTSDSQFCKKCATPLPPADNAQAFFTRTQETLIEEFT